MAKILIVDDDETVRALLTQLMTDAGYEVSSAGNGFQAEEACNKERFDLMIIDMVMPGKNGVVTVKEAARKYPSMKIIGISGGDRSFDGESYLDLVKERGAHLIFNKPFDGKDLLRAVKGLLEPGA